FCIKQHKADVTAHARNSPQRPESYVEKSPKTGQIFYDSVGGRFCTILRNDFGPRRNRAMTRSQKPEIVTLTVGPLIPARAGGADLKEKCRTFQRRRIPIPSCGKHFGRSRPPRNSPSDKNCNSRADVIQAGIVT